jgi:O-antigen/teichoic acid export membrane protein
MFGRGIKTSLHSSRIYFADSKRGPEISIPQYGRLLTLFRLQPYDTSNAGGRSKERYRRAAMTTVSSGLARAIVLVASLISVPLTFRYLGPERYGIWMILISIISAMSFADLGIGNGLINVVSQAYGKDNRQLAREYVTSAFVMMLCIAMIFAMAGAVSYPFIPWIRVFNVKSVKAAAEGARAFVVLFSWFVLSIPLGVVARTQTGLQQGYLSQIVGALGSILTLLALLVVIALHIGLPWLVFASTFGAIVATLVNGWLLFRQHPWLIPTWNAYSASSAKIILKLGLMFFVLQCAFAIAYTSDNIVIAQVLGAAAVAAYAVPQKLFGFVTSVVGLALGTLWPAYGEAIARGDVAWVRRTFLGSLWLTLIITVPLSSLLVLAGPWILRIFFGKELHASFSLLLVLALWLVVNAISGVIAVLLNGAGVLKVQCIVAVIASISNLAISILLTRRYGVIGVCSGSIITTMLITFPTCFYLIRNLFRRLANAKFYSTAGEAANLT